MSSARLRIAILISGRGSNMLRIAEACGNGEIAAEVVLVASDKAAAPGLAAAAALGLPTAVVAVADPRDRDAFDARLDALLQQQRPDLVVLAGFMRILGSAFVQRWRGRMLNIHPSLLPLHKGLHTHRRALEAGDRQHGASVHYVTPELDGGPVVLQGLVPVLPGDDEQRLSARVQACEHTIYPRAIGWIASGRLTHEADGPRLDGRLLERPLQEHCAAGDDARR